MFPEKSTNSNNIILNTNDFKNNNININTTKRFSGYMRANSQSQSKKIPRPVIRSKIILNNSNINSNNCNNNNNILSSIKDNINSNFVISNEKDENSKIFILKKNYDNRLGNLLLNFQKTINNLTNENAKELINEVIFMEKEKVISDLYEQNAIIKNEYEENKNEMTRLQNIISALEIDLHKTQKKLDEKNLELKQLNETLSHQQAENFDLNLKLKTLMEQIDENKHNNINVNLSKDFNFSIGNLALCEVGMGTADKSVLQLTEELNKLKDNKEENNENNENYTANSSNSNNTLISKYEDIINNLKNQHKEEIDNMIQENKNKINEIYEEMNGKIKEMKENNQKNEIKIKKYQNDLDLNMSENSKLNTKLKINEQIIILLRSKISSIKSEMKTFQKYVLDKFNNYNKDNQSIINIINQKIYNHFHNNNLCNSLDVINLNNDENIQELYDQIKIYENENKQLFINQKEYIEEIKSLKKKCDLYEKENNNLVGQINTLNMEIQLLNQSFNTLKNCNKMEISNILKKYKNLVKNKIDVMKKKYTQQIGELKTMISVLMCGMKKYNSIVLKYSNKKYNDKTNEEKKTKLIEEMQKKINGMKANQEEYIKAINKKNKRIKELQDALKNSLVSFSSGMKNIKIANLLDNEVKEFLKKSKETNESDNNEI